MLFAVLLLNLYVSEFTLPGEVWLTEDVGAMLGETLQLRGMSGVQWAPFDEIAWGGLREVTSSFNAIVSIGTQQPFGYYGNTLFQFWFGYGRPRESLWLSYEVGLSTGIGWNKKYKIEWQPENKNQSITSPYKWLKYAWLGSLRIGYNIVALRLTTFIIGGFNKRPVLHEQHYALTLEFLWSIYKENSSKGLK